MGKFLKYTFGLPFLNPADVGDCFGIEFAEILPSGHRRLEEFVNYMIENYICEEADFPPHMWAENSSSMQRTTNACESFHSKFNASFYCSHPNIFQFLEVLKDIQIDTYIKIQSAHQEKKVYRRIFHERQKFIDNKIEELKKNQISKFDFVKCLSYKFLPNVK